METTKIMKIKKFKLITIISFVFVSCSSNNLDSPYKSALQKLKDGNGILQKIFYKNQSETFDNKRVKLLGYISNSESILYLNEDIINPDFKDSTFRKLFLVKLYSNYNKQILIDVSECSNNNLVEIQGEFHVSKLPNGEPDSYYLTDIEKIDEFVMIPKHQGGTGEKHECYPELKNMEK